jgi:cytochrome c-type biogenesis protein CcmH
MTNPAVIVCLRQQLEQLNALHAEGVLGELPFNEARVALEQRIVQAVLAQPASAAAAGPAKASGRLLGGLALAVVAVAAAGYAMFGTPQALTTPPLAALQLQQPPASDAGGAHPLTSAQIEGMIDKLAARLKDKPDDADGWAMLGRSYAVLGNHALALPALRRAMALQPDDAVLLADAADALAVVNGRAFDGEPRSLIEKALKLDPDNLKALSLAGTMAFNRKDYAVALQHWERLASLSPSSELAKQIQGGIDEARSLRAGTGAGAQVAATASAPDTGPASPDRPR